MAVRGGWQGTVRSWARATGRRRCRERPGRKVLDAVRAAVETFNRLGEWALGWMPGDDGKDRQELAELEAAADYELWKVDPWLALETGADPEEMLRRERREQQQEEQQRKLRSALRAISASLRGGGYRSTREKPDRPPGGPAPEQPPPGGARRLYEQGFMRADRVVVGSNVPYDTGTVRRSNLPG